MHNTTTKRETGCSASATDLTSVQFLPRLSAVNVIAMKQPAPCPMTMETCFSIAMMKISGTATMCRCPTALGCTAPRAQPWAPLSLPSLMISDKNKKMENHKKLIFYKRRNIINRLISTNIPLI